MAKSLRAKRGRAGRPAKRARPLSRFAALRGTRKSGMTTDEIMNLLRGYDKDARDPGFKVGKK
jgi:hypothetical protein